MYLLSLFYIATNSNFSSLFSPKLGDDNHDATSVEMLHHVLYIPESQLLASDSSLFLSFSLFLFQIALAALHSLVATGVATNIKTLLISATHL